jgi:hypothetical protein
MEMNFYTSPHKLHRNDSIDTSIESANNVNSAHLEELVFNTIRSFGIIGCIGEQVLDIHKDKPYSSITARFKALLEKGYIEDTGERRVCRSGRKQRVMKAIR